MKKVYEFNTIIDLKDNKKPSLNITENFNNFKDSITVEIEAIHEMTTANYTTYPAKSLRGSEAAKTGAYSWTDPYEKPVLTHHNSYNGEPIGRVVGAEFKNSSQAGPPTILLICEITDKDAIEKVNDGRYKTVSIGGRAGHAYCSICGHDWVEEGYCEHWPGNEYEIKDGKKETAHLIMEDLIFDEVSFVNVPADKYAMIIKQAKDEDNSSVVNSADNNTSNQLIIEGIFKNSKGGYRMTLEEKVQILEEKVETKEGKIEVLEGKIGNLESDNKEIQEKLDNANEKVEVLEGEKELLESEVEDLTEENKTLKENQHKHLAEKVVEKKIAMGKIDKEDYEEALEKHINRTEESLSDTLEDLNIEEEANQSSEIGEQIDNPGTNLEENNVDNNDNTEDHEKRIKNVL
ncbi:MAG: hypothetical protein ACOCRO_02015 [Halanaerobiales bacterium]